MFLVKFKRKSRFSNTIYQNHIQNQSTAHASNLGKVNLVNEDK